MTDNERQDDHAVQGLDPDIAEPDDRVRVRHVDDSLDQSDPLTDDDGELVDGELVEDDVDDEDRD